MKLPNGDRAIIPIEKLTDYCLNPEHPDGKHKARVFASAMGITRQNAEELRDLVSRAAIHGEVAQQAITPFGQQFKVDWAVPGYDDIILRTIWLVPSNQPHPRLVSAFIK